MTLRVAVAGASGYVGRALLKELSVREEIAHVTALSRGGSPSAELGNSEKIQWKRCDLYSLKETEECLRGAQVAVYLVHSMSPKSRLVQGSFADCDLLLADNFARACRNQGIKRIVYLGGMIPQADELSEHLKSRQEVESALADSGCEVRVLRAGIVLGLGGSSTEIMDTLVKRLPIMVCPKWTGSLSHPIDLDDAVALLMMQLLDDSEHGRDSQPYVQILDGAGPIKVTYLEMLREIAQIRGLKRTFVILGWVPPWLSAFWVSSITGYSLQLVAPLVASLAHDLLPALGRTPRLPLLDWRIALRKSLKLGENPERRVRPWGLIFLFRNFKQSLFQFFGKGGGDGTVVSVQRFTCPRGWNAPQIALAYLNWLPGFMGKMLLVKRNGASVHFFVPILNLSLLELQESPDRSSHTRVLFYVVGGVLYKEHPYRKARLEFRLVKGQTEVLAAVLGFVPSLPWPIYRFSQALVHLMVMKMFGRFLMKHAKFGRPC